MESVDKPRVSGWRGAVVIDPKGANATRRRTRIRMGKTIILDPFRIVQDRPYATSFNLLDHLETDEETSK